MAETAQQQPQLQGGIGGASAAPEEEEVNLVWFRRDLRTEDHPALQAAALAGKVVAVFVWSPEEEGFFQLGSASCWWLQEALRKLKDDLAERNITLVLRRGTEAVQELLEVAEDVGASGVYFNELYDRVSMARDALVRIGLGTSGIVCKSFPGDVLFPPYEVFDAANDNAPFTTFDEYHACVADRPVPPPVEWVDLVQPEELEENVLDVPLEDLGLQTRIEESCNQMLSKHWTPGETAAQAKLREFIETGLKHFTRETCRVCMGRDGDNSSSTSCLSPYCHYGELSVKTLWFAVKNSNASDENKGAFCRQIIFREYSRYISFHFPWTHEQALLPHLRVVPWNDSQEMFKLWRMGKTGYPLVDAGMRCLWATGWVHNRLRVVVATFLVKFLLVPWQWGVKYFWDTLLDADLECDVLGWQYVSGGMSDGIPFDVIDDPVDLGRVLDPEGTFIRRWCPELSRLSVPYIHCPIDTPKGLLDCCGVELGVNYPHPVLDIGEARERLARAVAVVQNEEWRLENKEKGECGESVEVLRESCSEQRVATANNESDTIAQQAANVAAQRTAEQHSGPGVCSESTKKAMERDGSLLRAESKYYSGNPNKKQRTEDS